MTTAVPYGKVGAHLAAGDIDFINDPIKMLLVTSAYVEDLDAHEFRSAITNEVTGTGYTAGGATLASKTTTYIAADNQTAHKCGVITWDATGGSLGPARKAVLYKSTGAAATDILMGLITFDTDMIATNAAFTVTPDAINGILKL